MQSTFAPLAEPAPIVPPHLTKLDLFNVTRSERSNQPHRDVDRLFAYDDERIRVLSLQECNQVFGYQLSLEICNCCLAQSPSNNFASKS